MSKSGVFKNPSISPDGMYVAYTKNKDLFITPIDFTQAKKEVMKVSEKVVGYAWADNDFLSYSTEKSGLNGFNLKSKKHSILIQSEEYYDGIVGNGKGTIYAETYGHYIKNDRQYVEGRGLISDDVALGKVKVVVPSRPSSEDGGLIPSVARISKDGAYVYIWCRIHSGSTNSDGVPFGVYDVKNNKFTRFNKEKIFALNYKDNLTINPVYSRLSVLNTGGARYMNINKTLVELDVTSGNITYILPKNMISTSDNPYGITAKVMVTMTPEFSPDGKKIIFAASNANANMQQWESNNILSYESCLRCTINMCYKNFIIYNYK